MANPRCSRRTKGDVETAVPYQKILLTRPPTGINSLQGGSGQDPHPQPPLGLASVAAYARNDTEILPIHDGNFSHDYLADLRRLVETHKPDLVGFSAFTPFVRKAMEGIKLVKSIDPSILTVLGGPHATVLPEKSLEKCQDLDVIARDEGEVTFREIILGTPFKDMPGIVWRDEGRIRRNPVRPYMTNLDDLPYPAYDLLPQFPHGYRPHPPKSTGRAWTSAMWSRGCPFKCTYCTREASFGLQFRCNSVDYVLRLLRELHDKWGIEEITFYDDVFTLNQKKTLALVEAMTPEKLGFALSWDCETRVDLVSEKLLHAMARAGCRSIAYGVEHGVFIKEIKGGNASIEVCENAIRWTHEAGIESVGYFMIGLPRETPETVQKTIDFAKKLNVSYAQFAITSPYPGNELYREAIASGLKDLDDNWENFVYAGSGAFTAPVLTSQSLSREDLTHWKNVAYKEFYFRPAYVLQRIRRALSSWHNFRMMISGFRMLLGMMSRSPKPAA